MIYLQFIGLIVFLVVYVWFFSSHRENKKKNQLKQFIENNAFILDVRGVSEHKEHHAKGAVNIPLGKLYQKKDKLPSSLETPIIIYCRSGGSASLAVRMLRSMGYKKLINAGSLSKILKLEQAKEGE